ncbi:TPA: peptidase C14 [Vibrio parahaemolyticus]|uniref:PIN-like domain-containing protein n=1 Tax=Vibrio parahaemolyticus TaxID=670 RepID=UPI000FEC9220|nr:PIN domain-containing protein [Vibrio parahaemolyticus]MCX8885274.1 PIN-like domain-containing protein [Vibrio parahaemolyticus]HAS3028942.1 DUF4935 domain-containing protein [Vibrio parahaemolyticus]HAS3030906.1 DUF4935 domain-containing protein [Vibrio parahaemolyticus]HAS3034219.1 DUF4935 domain-containing protein [Vibrio parahaemolyticus]HAS3035934.1 DUF4935 domain-containing protein [Vibrio parahaemolyticus]
MRFGHHSFNKTIDEYHTEIAGEISSEKTLILIDTNILSYLFKLHANARIEFFTWAKSVIKQNRLFIPEWAANEYLNRVTTNKLNDYSHKSVNPKTAQKAYEALYEMASLFVDDKLLKESGHTEGREQYLEDFKSTIESLDKYTRPFKAQFNTGDVHNEIVEYFSDVVLKSDIASICARASQEGDARYEHRLPPGFKDGHKDENRFGDLIIWFELIEKSKESKLDFDSVLFLTNDEKSDWVYAPKEIVRTIDGERKNIANKGPQIRIADPRLVSEFEQNVGHSKLIICSLATLIESLSKNGDSKKFKNIAGAIQIDIQESISEPDDATDSDPDKTESVSNTTESNPDIVEVPSNATGVNVEPVYHYEYEREALRDSEYQTDSPGIANEIIRALKSYNWYTQNPAILRISSLVEEQVSPSTYFVLGRNIYQAACGNSVKAMEYISSLSSRLDRFQSDKANHILSGMLFEIYFDSLGEFRVECKFEFADNILSLLTNIRYESAKNFIRAQLEEKGRVDLHYLPGDTEEKILHISFVDGSSEGESLIASIQLDNVELIKDIETPVFHLGYDSTRIKQVVSENFAIPLWILTFSENVEWPTGIINIARDKKIASIKDLLDS